MRYLDSADGTAGSMLGNWLEQHLDDEVVAFRLQSGYFTPDVLRHFKATLDRLSAVGQPIRLALGSNPPGLPAAYARAAWDLVSQGTKHSLVIVTFSRGLFHPKAFHVVRADGSQAAYVGSANMTVDGAGLNVEAGLALDTRAGDPTDVLDDIAYAVDRWSATPRPPGAFPITSPADINQLAALGVLTEMHEVRPRTGRSGAGHTAASRRRAWSPDGAPESPPPRRGRASARRKVSVVAEWRKKLSPSDALRPPKPTSNPTGMLRLGKTGVPGYHDRWFIDELFCTVIWAPPTTGRITADLVAEVPFDVRIGGVSLGQYVLKVSWDLRRISGQINVPTVLHWQPLAPVLRAGDYRGHTVALRRRSDDTYRLEIA